MMVFYKSCSGGNDFLQIDAAELKTPPTPQRIRDWCRRHQGAGADGVVLYDRSVNPVSFRIFNQDGLEAELSGNGMAGLTALLAHLELASAEVELETKAGRFSHRILDRSDGLFRMEIDLGVPDFQCIRLFPFLADTPSYPIVDGFSYRDIRFFPVTVGNPQIVLLKSRGQSVEDLLMLAEELHDRPMFPFRTNVSVVDDRGDGVAHAFFYERGVGRTEASSTGSAGAYAVLRARNPELSSMRFVTPGGEEIKVFGKQRIRIENRTRIVYKGEYWEFADV